MKPVEDLTLLPMLPIAAETLVENVLYNLVPDSTWATDEEGLYGFQFSIPQDAISPSSENISFDLLGEVYSLNKSSVLIWNSTGVDTGIVWSMRALSPLFLQLHVFLPLPVTVSPNSLINDNSIYGQSWQLEDVQLRIIKRSPYVCESIDYRIREVTFLPVSNTSLLVGRTESGGIVEIGHDGLTLHEWNVTGLRDWASATYFDDVLLMLRSNSAGVQLLRVKAEDSEAEVVAADTDYALSGIAFIDSTIIGLRYDGYQEKTYMFKFDWIQLVQTGSFIHALEDSVELGSHYLVGPVGMTPNGQLLAKDRSGDTESIVVVDISGECIGRWYTPFLSISGAVFDGLNLKLHARRISDDGIVSSGNDITEFYLPPTIWSVEATITYH